VCARARIARRAFGQKQAPAPAKKPIGCDGIKAIDAPCPVGQWHAMLACHQIIFSEGAPTEAFFVGGQSLRTGH
jgi:hypothetical protein